MFDPQEHQELKEEIRSRISEDKEILESIIKQVRDFGLRNQVMPISKYHATALSIMASDGGNHKFYFDPFQHQLIRVVDNTGQVLARKSIALTTNLNRLFESEFYDPGTFSSPKSALGRLCVAISSKLDEPIRSLHDLSHMIPEPEQAMNPDNSSWVLTYRDLWEWAVLYDQIANKNFASDTIIVREGILRSKIFAKRNFLILGDLISESIRKAWDEQRKKIYLVGVAKKSSVIEKFKLAMMVEEIFPSGQDYYVPISREMEMEAYRWPEFARGRECIGQPREEPKFVFGSMFLVRFSGHSASPIRAVDVFDDQKQDANKIIGYLANDAFDSFPIPDFPMSIQRAHESAKLDDFDAEFLTNSLNQAVEDTLGESYGDRAKEVMNLIKLMGDPDSVRY